jgi:hypothetical protein
VWRAAAERQLDLTIVLEDDATFQPTMWTQLQAELHQLDREWDILYLGCAPLGEPEPAPTNENQSIRARQASVQGAERRSTAMRLLRNRTVRGDFRGIAHAAVSRRPPVSLSMIVTRTEGYTYAAKVWDLSLVQGQFLSVRFATFFTESLPRILSVRLSSLPQALSTAIRPLRHVPLHARRGARELELGGAWILLLHIRLRTVRSRAAACAGGALRAGEPTTSLRSLSHSLRPVAELPISPRR